MELEKEQKAREEAVARLSTTEQQVRAGEQLVYGHREKNIDEKINYFV